MSYSKFSSKAKALSHQCTKKMAQIFSCVSPHISYSFNTCICWVVKVTSHHLRILLDVDPYCVKIIQGPACVFAFPTVSTLSTLFWSASLIQLHLDVREIWQLGCAPEWAIRLYYTTRWDFKGLTLKPRASCKVLSFAFRRDSACSF